MLPYKLRSWLFDTVAYPNYYGDYGAYIQSIVELMDNFYMFKGADLQSESNFTVEKHQRSTFYFIIMKL